MLKRIILLNLLYCLTFYAKTIHPGPDLTIVGQVKFAESLPRFSIGWIDTLYKEISINCIPLNRPDFIDVPPHVVHIVRQRNKTPGKVALFLDLPWTIWHQLANKVPSQCPIKYAVCMLEGTAIPQKWVHIFNTLFDGVIVPDIYYKKVYEDCGVIKPIFVLPCGMFLDDFMNEPIKEAIGDPFTFGISAAFWDRKNHRKVIDAFIAEYGNNVSYFLKIHGRLGEEYEHLVKHIQESGVTNISITAASFNHQQYLEFLRSLDCYILVSKGEGFSLTPREALAMGIPCILSNNTSHETICASGCVLPVKAEVLVPSFHGGLGGYVGHNFDCKVEDVQTAMHEMVCNYSQYKNKAKEGRTWVKQYQYASLKKRMLTIVKPQKVLFGDQNLIEDDVLITNSEILFNKYKEMQ